MNEKFADKPLFKVLKGQPDDQELAALAMLIGSLANSARDSHQCREVNRWGEIAEDSRPHPIFNPNAFQHVSFY
ncbi:acyl-CoA carboxylase subunit epsilon [Corynebacterium sp. ES2794-CONJ1]|uniref:acyl-CoA carboxylase subunit epsilon n=1 Tax=unclassified Corynebacterium TaxID=2624378 RepID=UPI00216A5515|nr:MULTISPECIES: acyl-CoA carboxylase subunit epsilon [unclassified Corynebacterium]MCS4489510.1 acyl-CoA carboxylase subunit epsilon [Corynebacterium sp. ES2775-CONJ]MCS4491479.1 acyl-CoA carboxylase subunit epsilon [Corynebacterium sp. ES2715-CONJ3]MCS4531421.1 acyl-CoA carboxylase subunit epsilon [Corynebacterium sp. ES2730-CONJ]MCU9518808.1 acyl-CoA carboxylase subunit epsilon [Corynebacterium sp. ES2794-CONJ1]